MVPIHTSPEGERSLSRLDCALLGLFALVVFSWGIVVPKTLSVHESVHCVNAREMLANGDWIIPTYGGRVWLERPPLPFWLMAPFLSAAPDAAPDWVYRLPSVLVGLVGVLLTAWIGAIVGGRVIGLCAGVILTTSYEYFLYAQGAEADIYLALVVSTALAFFARTELGGRQPHDGDLRFLGWRPWTVLGFFVAVGLTNVTKGLIFGTLHVVVPVLGFLLAAGSWSRIRRYLWLPGWLAFAIAGGTWATLTMLRYPDVVELWKSDYLGRANRGAFHNPWWYYLANLPGLVMPWTIAAAVGLWECRPWRQRSTATGVTAAAAQGHLLLWCWAILPVAFFSFAHGKHHHYLLHCIPAWALLAAYGARRLWLNFAEAPRLVRHPLFGGLTLGTCGVLALTLLSRRLPGPAWKVPLLASICLAFTIVLWWALGQRDGRKSFATVATLAVLIQWLIAGINSAYYDRYEHDLAFLRQACREVPADRPFYVINDDGPLVASWFLHYGGGRLQMLHNDSFLRDVRITAPEVFVIARAAAAPGLARVGSVEVALQSEHTRAERVPGDRFTLFRMRLRDDLDRRSASVRISPMQATGRAPGPYLQ